MNSEPKPPIAAVTGSSRGLGEKIARILLDMGFVVHGCSRTAPNLVESHNYFHHNVDLSDPQQIQAWFKAIKKNSGGMDLLINNAGLSDRNLLSFTSVEAMQQLLQINVAATLLSTKAAIKLLRKSKTARIINISSIHVPLKTAGASLYGSTKAAIEQFTKHMATELAPQSITVNCLGLSFVQGTQMHDDFEPHEVEKYLSMTNFPHLLQSEHIENALGFLLAPEANCVTGQIIYLGGVSH